ncbi:5'-Nucleotidase domain protein [hydrothermal vent metagenome]|uniref:5'-Nucleotidase domain protein n=1 Tax=hydrothermal vent metagenome TaxID=652676 RepID=A0A3B1BSS7_9ZZZZ
METIMIQRLLTLLVLLFVFQNLYAGTIKIPNDQPTIQVGIVSSSNGDTILVSPGTYYENINFNGKNIVLGSLFLTTRDTSYISQTVIDGNQQGCVVVFESGEDSTTVLSGFTITNGVVPIDSLLGGGISCKNNSNLTLSYLKILNNESLSGDYQYGGGILILDSEVEIRNCIISENRARRGGGINLENSNVNISNSEISNNEVSKNGRGGGIWSRDSEMLIKNTKINSNNAFHPLSSLGNLTEGGGVYLRNCQGKMDSIEVSYNHSDWVGGGLAIYDSDFIIKNSLIIGNSANLLSNNGEGGGIYYVNINEGYSLKLHDVRIENNYAESSGGGISYYSEIPSAPFKNVTIKNNRSNNIGGGISTYSNLSLYDSSNCSIFLNNAPNGGSDVEMLLWNGATSYEMFLDTFTVSDPDEYHISEISNTILHYNHAVYSSIYSDIYVSPSGFDNNSGTSKEDPLMTIKTALTRIKVDSTNNRIIHLAPGIFSKSTNEELFPMSSRDYITIKGTSADSTILNGDGTTRIIDALKRKKVSFENITIQNGYGYKGGGIAVSGEDVIIKNLVICNNESESSGSGIYVLNSERIDLINLTVTDNISNNNDDLYDGGIGSAGVYNLNIINCIAYSNTPTNLSFATYPPVFPHGGKNTVNISNSNIEGGYEEINIGGDDTVVVNWLEGNIDEDPQFVGGDPFDYNLTDTSQCINAGTPFFVWEGDTLINLSPEEYIGEAPDMGALESDVLISVEGEETLPTVFKLEQNYPNPFNPSTTIKYSIPSVGTRHASSVRLVVYDLLGREVTTLVNKKQSAGNYEIPFDASNLTSGLYIYRLQVNTPDGKGNYVNSKKMILLK